MTFFGSFDVYVFCVFNNSVCKKKILLDPPFYRLGLTPHPIGVAWGGDGGDGRPPLKSGGDVPPLESGGDVRFESIYSTER